MPKTISPVDQKDMILGRMETMMRNMCDAMAQLSEFPMELNEVDRVRKICDVMIDLRRAMYRFAIEHDDLIHGVRSRPGREFEFPANPKAAVITHARDPKKIRREGATR